MSNKLYVGNLSYSTTENDLAAAFSEVGTVKNVTLIQNRDTGQSRGFGFVTMGADSEAAEAIRVMHGRELGGRRMTVTEARPKEDRPPGSRPPGPGYSGQGQNQPVSGGGSDRGFVPRRPDGAAPGPRQEPSVDRRPRFNDAPRSTPSGPAKFQDPPKAPVRQKDWEVKKPKTPGRPKPPETADDDFEDIDYRWRG